VRTFAEFLAEGRDAPLYHGTSLTAAGSIVYTDIMQGGRRPDPVPGRATKEHTASFTRDYKFAYNWSGADCVMVFDQTKLSHNHKIIPSNFWAQAMHSRFQPYGRVARPARQKTVMGGYAESESEELIIGPIKNISRYLIKIIVKNQEYARLKWKDPAYVQPLIDAGLLYTEDGEKIEHIFKNKKRAA